MDAVADLLAGEVDIEEFRDRISRAVNFNFVTNTPDLRSFLTSNSVDFVKGEAAAPDDEGSKSGLIRTATRAARPNSLEMDSSADTSRRDSRLTSTCEATA